MYVFAHLTTLGSGQLDQGWANELMQPTAFLLGKMQAGWIKAERTSEANAGVIISKLKGAKDVRAASKRQKALLAGGGNSNWQVSVLKGGRLALLYVAHKSFTCCVATWDHQ